MKLLHICIFFRNPMFSGLISKQMDHSIDLRVLYYETRKIGLKKFEESYVDLLPSDVWYLPSPLFRVERLKLVYKKMRQLYPDFSGFDLIHAHTLCQDGYLAWRVYHDFNIPYVVTIRNCDFTTGNLWGIRRNRKIYIRILECASGITFLSESARTILCSLTQDEALNKMIMLKGKVVPNGIDDYWHNHARGTKRNVPCECINFLTVGRIEKNKNQLYVAGVLNKFARKHNLKIKYVLVGKIIDREYYDKIMKYEFVEYLEFCPKEKLIQIYQNCDVYIMLSHSESFGLSYVEAMSQGLPVIYTSGQGFDGQFDDGTVGYAADDKNEESVVVAIEKVLKDYEKLSSNCIVDAEDYSWKNAENRYISMYDSCLMDRLN